MAKITPAAVMEEKREAEDNGGTHTLMGLIGTNGIVGDVLEQQLDIPIFKTEEGRYLAEGEQE